MENRLQEIRLAKGLSQKGLSDASGISVRMIQHYEQGFRELWLASYSTVYALASALDVSPSELFIKNTD